MEKTKVVEMNGIKRMIILLGRGLASGCSTALGAALVAVYLVAIGTRIIQLFTDIDEVFEISRLRCAMGELSNVYELFHILLPVGAIHRNRPAVLATAARR